MSAYEDDAFAVLGAVLQHRYADASSIINDCERQDLLACEIAGVATAALEAIAYKLDTTADLFFQTMARQRVQS